MVISRVLQVILVKFLLRKLSLLILWRIPLTICRYPNTSLWVTEYALAAGNLADNQYFFRTSAEYMDRISYVGRYSYFGSFRSDISNVGANAAMLDAKGRLTDIGAWYLGQAATGNIPSSAGREGVQIGLVVAAVMAGLWML